MGKVKWQVSCTSLGFLLLAISHSSMWMCGTVQVREGIIPNEHGKEHLPPA